MHIPRQPDAFRMVHAGRLTGSAGAGTPAVRGPATLGSEGLRARRQHLIGQRRSVAYWQRLVQARTDLLVAGLLYCAPVPSARDLPGAPLSPEPWAARGPELQPGSDDLPDGRDDLHALASPPDGLDVVRLLGAPGGPGGALDGPGAHLDRLRSAAATLASHRRGLDYELDAVTLALHRSLAEDGADGLDSPLPRPAATATSPVTS